MGGLHSHFNQSKLLINATGAFTDQHNELVGVKTNYSHLFSKGVYLIVPRISDNNRVLAFFADDGRLFFAIPMGACTCIGTTDTRLDDMHTEVTDEDREFILLNINAKLDLPSPLTRVDVISERCGVWPLVVKNDFHRTKRVYTIFS